MSRMGRDEATLSEDQKQLNNLLSILPGMFYRCHNDPEWTMQFVSEGCLDLTGYQPDDLVNNNRISYGDIVHVDDRQRVWDVVQAANEANTRFTVSYRIISADGEEKWVWEQGLVMPAGENELSQVEGIITDITELIQTEQALSEREARLRSIFLAAPVGIGIVSNRVLLDVNDRICEITGYSKNELVGKKSTILYPSQVEFDRVGVEKYKQIEEEGTGTVETQFKRKDGQLIDVLLSSTPIDPKDLLAGVTFTALDITDRKQAEKDILDYTRRIEALLEVDNLITSSLEIDQVLAFIMTELEKVITYDSTTVQLLRDNHLEVVAAYGFPRSERVEGIVFPLESEFPNFEVITTREVLALEDISQAYPHFRTEANKYLSAEICSWLGVPLISKGNIIGMLALDRTEINPFSKDEIRLVTAFANQAASALENARLFSDANRRLERLTSLSLIDDSISASLDLRETLNVFLGQVVTQLQVDAADVLLYKPDTQTLEYESGIGFRTSVLQHTRLRLGQSHAGLAALERRLIEIPDLNRVETDFPQLPQFTQEAFISYYGVPLIAKGDIVGVLEIFNRTCLEPDPEWNGFLNTLATQAAVAIDNATLYDELHRSNENLVAAYDATIEGWARALELRDQVTEEHARRVVDLVIKLASSFDISGEDLTHIRRGALLHDIGKMGVPDSILQKKGNLTDAEWDIMRQHTTFAYEMLKSVDYLRPALEIPLCHHEKWDGTGYPSGLTGEQIPLAARIFAVVDVFDALLSDRPYRKAWSKDKVLSHIRQQSGVHFDPEVVERFLKIILVD
ncbi:MAG: PAS domain S-box protein [Chloroflexi bacterium]|nr:MAG: PAS domain S-box protein [Chloroflexota bacterium]MBL1196539.1 PAS domain S-box protein [Chloroflexota bacterium]NOH13834.1 PAS domain S-box protein [Chloroflexota bacterium]